MLFPTHLLVGALAGRWARLPVVWAVAGAALPDLVDKPLAALGIVDVFHSVGHSALLAIVVVPLALTGRAGVAFAIGWGSHLALDALHVVINGRPGDAAFLLWPLAVPADPLRLPPVEFLVYYLWSPSFFVEVLLWVAVIVLCAYRRRHDGW